MVDVEIAGLAADHRGGKTGGGEEAHLWGLDEYAHLKVLGYGFWVMGSGAKTLNISLRKA